MSGANYEYCPVCDLKALYVGEDDLPPGVVIIHKACMDKLVTDEASQATDAERKRIVQLALLRVAECPDYWGNPMPFARVIEEMWR